MLEGAPDRFDGEVALLQPASMDRAKKAAKRRSSAGDLMVIVLRSECSLSSAFGHGFLLGHYNRPVAPSGLEGKL